MRGIVIWSLVMMYAFWRVPKMLPHSVKLARIAVMCGFIVVLAALYRETHGVRYWSPDQSSLTNIVTLVEGGGMFGGLICGAIAFILDAKRRPSPRGTPRY